MKIELEFSEIMVYCVEFLAKKEPPVGSSLYLYGLTRLR